MAEQLDVQGLIVLTESDRFVTIGRGQRARVWRIDLTGEPVEDVDRTGVAAELPPVQTERPWSTSAVLRGLADELEANHDVVLSPVQTEGLLQRLRVARAAVGGRIIEAAQHLCAPNGQTDHAPVQHRDGKVPWCAHCRRTADGVPVEELGRVRG